MKAGFVIAMFAAAVLCANAMAQESAQDWYNKGREMLGVAPLEEVIKAYDKALELDPGNTTYWAAKGSILSFLASTTDNNQSRYNESLEAYRRSLELDPENPWTWDLMGSTLLQMKRYNESLEARERAIEYVGGYQGGLPATKTEMLSSIWAGKAFTLQEAGRMEEAIAAFERAIQIDPGNSDAYMMKGRALKAMGEQNGSLLVYDMDEGITPTASEEAGGATTDSRYKESQELFNNGSYGESVKALDRAIEIEPQNATLWLAKGQGLRAMAYGLSGQESTTTEEAAIKAYEKAIQIDPNYTDAWISKGFILLQTTRLNSTVDPDKCNESLNSFDKALELNPKNANAWQGRGSVLLSEHRFEEAVESYDNALENDPSNIGASQGKGQALAALGRKNESAKTYDKSLETLDRAIETANSTENLSQAWLMKGFALQEQDRYEDAVKALDNATTADPKNEMAWKVKGVLLSRELKRHNEAIEAFDKALQINPKDPRTWQSKGDALKALGRNSEADAVYTKVKELGYTGSS